MRSMRNRARDSYRTSHTKRLRRQRRGIRR